MSKETYVCPRCLTPLESRTCDACGLDIDDLFRSTRVDNEAVLEGLKAAGAYYDASTRELVIPGEASQRPFLISIDSESKRHLLFSSFVCDAVGCSPKRFGRQNAISFLKLLHNEGARNHFPYVVLCGDRPQLVLGPDDNLYFPDVCRRPPLSQLIQLNKTDDGRPAFMRYTGPGLHPQSHGGIVDEFLYSIKCADDANRDALRAWLSGALLAGLIPPGQHPALLLAADDHGAGKTTTAEVVAAMLGGYINLAWQELRGEDDLNRRAMDPSNPCLIADNMEADGDGLINDSHLANFITASRLNVKQLYASTGSISIPNYTRVIITANQPALTGELLSRCIVVSLYKDLRGEMGWSDQWKSRRVPLLEELMHDCIEGWRRGPIDFPCDTRFDTWFGVVGRALRRPPVSVPPRTTIKAPIEFVLDRAVPQLSESGPVTLKRLLTWMDGAKVGTAGAICRQQRWTEAKVVADIRRYVSKYGVEGEVIKRSEA